MGVRVYGVEGASKRKQEGKPPPKKISAIQFKRTTQNKKKNYPPQSDLSMCNCAKKKTHKTPHSDFVSFLPSR